MIRGRSAPALLALVLVLGACGSGDESSAPRTTAVPPPPSVVPTTSRPPMSVPTTSTVTTTTLAPGTVVIPLRFERQTTDPGTAHFAEFARAVLTDGRGWQSAGFHFRFTSDAPYRVLLAEPDVVDAACEPYDTGGQYSCQIGPTVALNADRWRSATSSWPGSLDDYRTMLVNHEVGHLLGLHHPEVRCPGPGQPAPVMAQQSIGLEGCAPNPWPLPWELACMARHEEPVAPGYEPDAGPLCGPGDV